MTDFSDKIWLSTFTDRESDTIRDTLDLRRNEGRYLPPRRAASLVVASPGPSTSLRFSR